MRLWESFDGDDTDRAGELRVVRTADCGCAGTTTGAGVKPVRDGEDISDEDVINVHLVKCGCGHVVTALHYEIAQAAMLEHLLHLHRGEEVEAA